MHYRNSQSRAARIFGDKCSVLDTTYALESALPRADWANLRTDRVGTWQPVRAGPLASGTRPRLAQSWPARRYSCESGDHAV